MEKQKVPKAYRRPRLISDKINRQTKTLIEVDFGINERDTYQATCYGKYDSQGNLVGPSHGYYVNANTLNSIMRLSASPLDWCYSCQKNDEVFKVEGAV